jgi:hypothetical protein
MQDQDLRSQRFASNSSKFAAYSSLMQTQSISTGNGLQQGAVLHGVHALVMVVVCRSHAV